MPTPSPSVVDTSHPLYKATMADAAAGGDSLMAAMVRAAAIGLREREKQAKDMRERDACAASLHKLMASEPQLRADYPKALLAAFLNPQGIQPEKPAAPAVINFDQLELMDADEVQGSIVMARAQQTALTAAEASLDELNTLISGVLGLKSVQPERNPLRPDVYVAALQAVIRQQNAESAVQMDWLAAMSVALGQELRSLYQTLAARLKDQGVEAVGYSVRRSAPSNSRAAEPVAPSRSNELLPKRVVDPTLLTLDKLRRLLAGELQPAVQARTSRDAFEQQFARQFESGSATAAYQNSDFDATVPAALEALHEMQQVEQVVQRLEQRRQPGASAAPQQGDDVAFLRNAMRSAAKTMAQAISLEVVTLMIENIARDPRLLPPVQRMIARLEPAYLRLSLVDARLFTDKYHPARALIQEITHRSLAYPTMSADGFQSFMRELEAGLQALMNDPVESAAPFQAALNLLQAEWQRDTGVATQAREEAVEVLQHVEQRTILAEKIARDIVSHRDAGSVPAVVIEFLCGPWAHVVAQARLTAGAGSSHADKYQALVSALLWSTHPELTRKNTAKLTRLVPLLLATLREGLDTIRFPGTKTAAFFEALMGLHQQAFKTAEGSASGKPPEPAVASEGRVASTVSEPWVAPDEAQASNFVEMQASNATDSPAAPTDTDLPMGTWVELRVEGHWVRTQLTWTSPHGTLFLFTSATGTSQSMTRRSRDRLIAAGNLRVIASQPLVEGALNAVAQIALRNSMDITL